MSRRSRAAARACSSARRPSVSASCWAAAARSSARRFSISTRSLSASASFSSACRFSSASASRRARRSSSAAFWLKIRYRRSRAVRSRSWAVARRRFFEILAAQHTLGLVLPIPQSSLALQRAQVRLAPGGIVVSTGWISRSWTTRTRWRRPGQPAPGGRSPAT
jgi:hypothetical protein